MRLSIVLVILVAPVLALPVTVLLISVPTLIRIDARMDSVPLLRRHAHLPLSQTPAHQTNPTRVLLVTAWSQIRTVH